ncbi:MAG: glucosaminidase domain-containing protein [Bacteroidales bacterium]|nr:glucosaminidase domain-containing protein [Bacteroidales bacterium]HOI32831.1 glucosaminidase domain-containing protein [Bacteroidales bacterium]
MKFATVKSLILIFLLALLNLGTGSANLAESVNERVYEPMEMHYVQTESPFFSGIKPQFDKPAPPSDFLLDFSNLKADETLEGNGKLTKERMMSFLWLHNTALSLRDADELVSLYITEASHEGINHDVAFVQMCLETGFLRFGGDVDRDQFNYCGLGATGNGEPGLSFTDVQEGVRAHIQHLKAYASTEKLNKELVDSRFAYVKRGSVKNIEQLTGKWAADPHYHHKLKSILQRLYSGSYASAEVTKPNSGF